jgi:DNA-binding NarL/FixJ family response regulator
VDLPREGSIAEPSLVGTDAEHNLRILLVDSQDLIHWGFRSVLRREPWVERLVTAHNSAQAISLVRRYRPHVAVVATDLAGESPTDLCKELRRQSPSTRILLTSGERVSEHQARSLGAAGVVPKTWQARAIAGALRAVALGRQLFTPDQGDLLTARERVVLGMLAEGSTNREVADRLTLSPHTVKDHVSSLLRKLNARNRADAVVRAQRLGLL